MRAFLVVLIVLASCVDLARPAHAAIARPSRPAGQRLEERRAVQWFEDDFPGALAAARSRHVPLFVDVWAPWCHSCRSMWAYVLNDASLSRHAGQYVFLSIDGEKAKNAEFRRRFPVPAIPSFLVIEPATATVSLRWIGGLTLAQLHTLLDDSAAGRGVPRELLPRLVRADSLYAASAYADASAEYLAVMDAAPSDWRGYARAAESCLFALTQAGQPMQGVVLARAALSRIGPSASALNVASSGLGAALELPESLAVRSGAIAEFEAATRAFVADTSYSTAGDDRSGAWIEILSARQDARDSVGSRAAAEAWAELLERETARANSAEQRAVYDSHRLSAYIELGQPERAVPYLQRSERELPDDYNPSARLATAFKQMKRWEDALAASDRAMTKAYGPRKMLIFTTRADIFEGRGDVPGARRTLEEAIAFGEALPEPQRPVRTLDSLRKRLEQLAGR